MAANATLTIKISPRRMLTGREAAAYCGMRQKGFAEMSGVSPVILPDGSEAFDIQDLDRMIEARKGGEVAADEDIVGRLG
jgi:hypothetical protein